jgi:tRNA (cmo5U34)-methyltransferase
VHHLKGDQKAVLFQRIQAVLRPGGRFLLADVVVPERPEDAMTPLSPDYDHPSTLPELLGWLQAAGFSPTLIWKRRDLAVIAADDS